MRGAKGAIPRNFPKSLRRLCDQYGVLLIFDEVATGWSHRAVLRWIKPQVCPICWCWVKA